MSKAKLDLIDSLTAYGEIKAKWKKKPRLMVHLIVNTDTTESEGDLLVSSLDDIPNLINPEWSSVVIVMTKGQWKGR